MRSHLLVAAFGLVALALVLRLALFVREQVVQVAERDAPAAEITLRQLEALEGVQASLRGWVALGDDSMRESWQRWWTDVIHPGLGALHDMRGRWTHHGDAVMAEELGETLAEFEKVQWWVAEVANSPADEPALTEYERHVAPTALALDDAIASWIELEARLPARELSGARMVRLAALRVGVANAAEALRRHAASGGVVERRRFEAELGSALDGMTALSHGGQPPAGRFAHELAGEVGAAIAAFGQRAQSVLGLRAELPRGVAEYWLARDALPLAQRARSILENLTSRQTTGMHAQATWAARLSDTLVVAAVLAVLGSLLTATFASRRAARRITEPVLALSEGARGLVDGRVDAALPVRGDAEIADLIRSFNRLWAAVRRGEVAVRDEVWAKSQFLAGVSHAIRTPMNGIVGMTELLQLRETDRDRRHQLQQILGACSGLLGLLNDVFDFSRLEIGRLELKSVAFSPRSVMRDVLDDLEPEASSRGLTLKAEFDPRLPGALVGDPDALRRVLSNLGKHVIGFASDQTVTFDMAMQVTPPDVSNLRVGLADVGPRIAPRDAGAIFEPFTRLEPAAVTQSLATGLELSIARRLCELMDGEMWLAHRDGRDVFEVSLPLPAAETAAEELESRDTSPLTAHAAVRRVVPSSPDPRSIGRAQRGLHILVAEDEPINQRVATELLELRGHAVTLARTGEEAVRHFSDEAPGHFDVILMDVQMPRMDGLEATRAIRHIEERRGTRIRIVALTAYAQSEDRQRCLDAGMDDYLAKPLHASQLYERVERSSTMVAGGPEPSSSPG